MKYLSLIVERSMGLNHITTGFQKLFDGLEVIYRPSWRGDDGAREYSIVERPIVPNSKVHQALHIGLLHAILVGSLIFLYGNQVCDIYLSAGCCLIWIALISQLEPSRLVAFASVPATTMRGDFC